MKDYINQHRVERDRLWVCHTLKEKDWKMPENI